MHLGEIIVLTGGLGGVRTLGEDWNLFISCQARCFVSLEPGLFIKERLYSKKARIFSARAWPSINDAPEMLNILDVTEQCKNNNFPRTVSWP